eukprot:TRINITY_DN27293_c0_g1_i1.p1 TRINITY_DN27293_c0_g1~~TRINITY_DN27293_c0_g1_i1.p1  ORF type:complete len:353 (-),score=101.07 TRINITY_DN27293_c0_g1_i1:152-1210(-)
MPDGDAGGGAAAAAAAFEQALAKEEAAKAAAAGPASPPPGSPDQGEELGADGEPAKKEKKKKLVKAEKMDCVKDEELNWIWIGGLDDARDAEALRANNVRYILNCTPERTRGGVSNFHEKDPFFSYCRIAMGDNSTETLKTRYEIAWAFLEKARIREDGGVLIHCQQGVSRSVSLAMCYMMKYYGKSFDEAFNHCRTARSQANPNEGFTNQLKELDELLRTTNGYTVIPEKERKRNAANRAAAKDVSVLLPGRGAPAGAARGPAGPPRGPVGPAGPARGPVGPAGPAKGPVGPAGPPRGPSGPSVGPAGPPRGPAGPSVGPAGPPVGPAGPEKRPAAGPAVGPAGPPKKAKA